MKARKFKLLKDLPHAKAGTVFVYDEKYEDYFEEGNWGSGVTVDAKWVSNTEWFKEIPS